VADMANLMIIEITQLYTLLHVHGFGAKASFSIKIRQCLIGNFFLFNSGCLEFVLYFKVVTKTGI